jgi:hypothetical protein
MPDSNGAVKRYIGERHGGSDLTRVLVDDGTIRVSLEHHVRHSPTGFEWGYGGSGPSDLARCILLDYLDGAREPEELAWVEASYQDFKFAMIADLPREGFELTAEQINEWAEARA